jgi:hypothetical protein
MWNGTFWFQAKSPMRPSKGSGRMTRKADITGWIAERIADELAAKGPEPLMSPFAAPLNFHLPSVDNKN